MLFYTHLHYLNNGGRVPIGKANKRISAPYSIWKILAHAQYYVKLARVLFSRDFFLQTNKLIVWTATRHLENKTEIGKGRLCRKNAIFSSNLLSGCSTYYVACFATALPDTMEPNFGQKKAKWVFCNELRNVLYVQFCKERSILRFFLIWYSIKSFGPIFEDWVECALCHPLQFRGSYRWIIWFFNCAY